MRMKLSACLMIGAVLAWAGGAGGAILLYEPFDYTAGAALAGVSGLSEINLTGTYTKNGSLSCTVGTGNLAYPAGTGWTAPTLGNDLSENGQSSSQGDYSRNIVTSFGDSGGASTMWFSFLMNPSTANYNSTVRFNGTGSLQIGYGGGSTTGAGKWQLSGGTATVAVKPTYTSVVTLVVVRVDFSGNTSPDTAYMFLNPGTTQPAIGTAISTVSSINFGDFTNMSVHYGTPVLVDEIKVATSYAELVPEPATMGVLLAGAMGCLFRRRRR